MKRLKRVSKFGKRFEWDSALRWGRDNVFSEDDLDRIAEVFDDIIQRASTRGYESNVELRKWWVYLSDRMSVIIFEIKGDGVFCWGNIKYDADEKYFSDHFLKAMATADLENDEDAKEYMWGVMDSFIKDAVDPYKPVGSIDLPASKKDLENWVDEMIDLSEENEDYTRNSFEDMIDRLQARKLEKRWGISRKRKIELRSKRLNKIRKSL